MPATLEEAQEELAQVIPVFEQCVRSALVAYVRDYAGLRHNHSKRSQASIISDLMIAELRKAFGEKAKVKLQDKSGTTFAIVLNGKYKIKMKKLDARLHARNIPTNEVLNYVHQTSPQTHIEGIPDPTNLHIGYQLVDPATMTEAPVWMTCPAGSRKNLWSLEITKLAMPQSAPTTGDLIKFPTEQVKKRVKIRKSESDKKDDKKNSEKDDDAQSQGE